MANNKIVAYFKSQVKPHEWPSLIWSFLYFYFLLTGYFILRPIREVMGVTAGPENYDVLFSATFIVMLLIQPIYGKIVSTYSRKQFIPMIYGFFALMILSIWGLFQFIGTDNVALARVFFVFVSVYNVFVVSVFWSFMSDVYNKKQGKRLFGVIAAGGSTGGITGGIITAAFVHRIGTVNLLLVSFAFLLLCIFAVYKVRRFANETTENKEAPIGGSPIEGIKLIFSSKLLQQIALMTVMSVLIGGIFYTLQGYFVKEYYPDREARTAIFANINTVTNMFTLFFQLILTPFFLQKFKIYKILGIYPTMMIFAFILFGFFPVLNVVLGGIIMQRSGAYGIMKPPTDWLFTGLSKNIKYKFKNFLDTVIYRAGDVFTQLFFVNSAVMFSAYLIKTTGNDVFNIKLILAVSGFVFSVIWLINAINVGRLAHETYEKLENNEKKSLRNSLN
jgi:AAA family ATP:ADP antiporter